MSKYSFEFKKKVVQAYLNGEGGRPYIANKYGIPASSNVMQWVNNYKQFGDDGLKCSHQNKKFSFERKLAVVELYLSSELSYQDLALQEGITNPSMIANWVNRFRTAGPDALRPRKKGRKKTLDKHVNNTQNKSSAELSVVLAQSSFIKTFNLLWSKLEIEQVEYLSEPLCEGMFILEKEERERTCIVIDIGARSTSVAFFKGDAMTNLTSFSMGGSYITSDLCEACKINYNEARNLKKEIVLSLKGNENDTYELLTLGGKVIRLPLNFVNEAVCYRIGLIASTVNECIRLFAKEYVPFYPIYLCGAGITKIKGAKDYLAKCLNRNVSYGVPPIPSLDKPELSAILGLVNAALNNE